MEIDSKHVHGEPGTGYEGPEKGLFACKNCEYFSNGSCGQVTMMERSTLPKTAAGRPKVSPDGCCEYIERKGTAKSGRHWLAGGS